MSDTALALRAIDKRFGVTTALAGASLTVRRGTLHAVLGENGAGKTTLMRIAFGMLRPDAGTVTIEDKPVVLASSADAMRRGLGMVHQHFTLVPAMTTAENIALGGHGMLRARDVAARVRALAGRTGLAVDPDARVSTLGVGAQQRVEILKALAGNAHTLILDEPTAVLTPGETEELFGWLRHFVADGGTVVLVTHKLQEALSIADDVTVLRRGAHVLTEPAAGLEVDDLVRSLTGEDSHGQPLRTRVLTAARGSSVVRLVDACARDARGVVRVQSATIECFAGEIVGIAGIEGSGVHELLRLLAGRLTPSAGSVVLPSTIGFVPEDRQRDALIEEFSLTENFCLRSAATRTGRISWPAIEKQTGVVMRAHDVRAPSPATLAGALSGGNQQKFILGRELDARPALVVAENPVRGLDHLATAQVLRELQHAADAGSAVVLYSGDLDELLPVGDRMFVMFAGRLREVPVTRSAVAGALVGAS
ncbi:MAG: ATP-binding cassette domain-containing protein [Gemmatimonadota bacterium]